MVAGRVSKLVSVCVCVWGGGDMSIIVSFKNTSNGSFHASKCDALDAT